MRKVTLYTRPGCHLCEEVLEQLRRLQRETTFEIDEVNIDQEPALRERYDEDIPVVAVDGREAFKHRVDMQALKRMLG